MDNRTKHQLTEAQNAFRSGKVESARLILADLLQGEPEQIDALFLKAHVERADLQFDIARECLINVLNLESISINNLKMLAQQFSQLELYFLLSETLQRLDKLEPHNPKILFQLGLCFARIGNIDESIRALKNSLSLDKNNHIAILNLGHAYKAKGQSELAAEQYHHFISIHPAMLGTGYWSLADLKDYKFSQHDFVKMKEGQGDNNYSNITKSEIALLAFARARALEQKKNISDSFDQLRIANQIVSQSRPFKAAAYQQLVKTQLSYKPSIKTEMAKESVNPTPIFIVGMPRSGTTLTEQILASHSEVATSDELPFIERIAMQLCKGKSYIEAVTNISPQQITRFANYYLEQVKEYTGGKHKLFIDKNPTNFLHIALIKRLFPEAKIIALLRDPLDNAISVYKQNFSRGNDFSFQMNHIIEYSNGYLALLQHWQNEFANQIHHLKYHTLVTEPEQSIRSLLKYCELDFQAQCLEFYTSKRPILTPSVSQVRQPITTKALGSGNDYLAFLPDIKDALNSQRVQIASLE